MPPAQTHTQSVSSPETFVGCPETFGREPRPPPQNQAGRSFIPLFLVLGSNIDMWQHSGLCEAASRKGDCAPPPQTLQGEFVTIQMVHAFYPPPVWGAFMAHTHTHTVEGTSTPWIKRLYVSKVHPETSGFMEMLVLQ